MRFASIKRYLRRAEFAPDTEEQRAEERHRQIFLTTLSSGVAKILAVAISFGMIPLTLNYLGQERFGLWMAIVSAVAMLGATDLGVGSGLVNAVASGHGVGSQQVIQSRTTAGLLLMSAIALLITALFFMIEPLIPWVEFFGIRSELAAKEVGPTITTVVICFAIGIPAGVIFKVQMGLQMGFYVNLWLALSSILGGALVLCAIYSGGGLPHVAASAALPPVFIGLMASIYFWRTQKPEYRPNFKVLSIGEIKALARTSGLFFMLQLSGLIAFQSDNLIIAYYLGPESVTLYAIALKLFGLPSVIMSFFLHALWPAYAEAKSRGDKEWIRRSFLKSMGYSAAIVVPLSVIMLFGGGWMIDKWVGPAVKPGTDLLLGLFFWSILTILGGNFAVLLNGLGVIRFQIITSILMAIANLGISIFLVQLVGVSGAVWGSVLSLTLIIYIPAGIYLRNYFK